MAQELVQQSTDGTKAGMIVNGRKTKKMFIGAAPLKAPPPFVIRNGAPVERVVATFKLLGVRIEVDKSY